MPVSLAEPAILLPEFQMARITADEYQAMTDSGVLKESPIELLDGFLVWKDRRDHEGSIMNIGTRHAKCVDRLHRRLDRGCTNHGCYARSQLPVRISAMSVPEPDISIVLGDPEDDSDEHPTAAETLLVVEVADSSLKQDQGDKLRRYASAGVPEYWIVNLLMDELEVHREPDVVTGAYRSRLNLRAGATVDLTLPDGFSLTLDVAKFLP